MSNFYKNDALLYPATYIPIYSHLKGVININNVGKFHLYSICGCHVIKFPMLLWWWSIHEMAHFGRSLRSNSPKYCPIVLKLLPEVVLKERKTMFAESLKNWDFYRSGRYPTFAHLVQLWAKMAKIKENKKLVDKNSVIGLSKSAINTNTAALSPFKWKIGLLFALFESFSVKIRAWSKVKGSEPKSNLAYAGATISGVLNMQRVLSHHLLVLRILESKDVFLKKFKPSFQVWLLF